MPYSIRFRAILDKPGPPIWATLSGSLTGGHPYPTPPHPYPSPLVPGSQASSMNSPGHKTTNYSGANLLPGLGKCILNTLMPLNHTATAVKNRPRATFLTTSPRIQCPLSLCHLCQVGQKHCKASSQPIFLKLSSILKNTAGLLPE